MAEVVEIAAPAKVNLALEVLAQEAGGYHSLESVFCALSLADSLRITRGGGRVELVVSGGIEVGPERDNLVVRAARRFLLELGGVEEGVHIELHKRIPAAAGMGGGSSDAAATLRALNALFGEPFAADRLLQMGIELGSDVPFFLGGSALALGWSRGERLLSLPALPSRPVLVAHPGQPMSTGAAFQRIAELRGGGYAPRARCLPLTALTSWEGIARIAINDFDAVADEQLPQLAGARQAMRDAGASIALLAGSGASIFGVFGDAREVASAEAEVRELGFSTWRTETLTELPAPVLGGGSAG